MIEILEKVSEQVRKVENTLWVNAHSGGRVLYPPASQTRVGHPNKLSIPPTLPIFLGQEPVPSTEGSID